MNSFGGDWTKTKIEVLVDYAKAYLRIMNKYPQYRTLYFDGFAGSGFIVQGDEQDLNITIGAARRIVEIEDPTSFDGYYFVEKDKDKLESLKHGTTNKYTNKTIHLVDGDCNKKLCDMAEHLNKPKSQREFDKVLAYIDPCGMQLEWSSVEALEGIDADFWVLVPTGLGVNRLLVGDGKISEGWIGRLELFLGLTEQEIKNYFYEERTEQTLFGEMTRTQKKSEAIDKAAKLYKNRLSQVFKYVTDPLELKNEKNSVMYHYLFASNNKTAAKIAKDIIKTHSN